MDDELGQSRVEAPVREGQALRGRQAHVDAGVARPNRGHEGLGRVDGRDGRRTQPRDQLRRERTRAAADVEHPLARPHPGEVGQLGGQEP